MASFVEICSLRVRCSSCYALSDRIVCWSASVGFSILISTTMHVKIGIFMSHSGGGGLIVARYYYHTW